MKIKTNIKAGGVSINHNQNALAIKSNIKAGGMKSNHNQNTDKGQN